jgi:hypothetical protein
MYERIANKNTEKGINYFSQILCESHLGSLNSGESRAPPRQTLKLSIGDLL